MTTSPRILVVQVAALGADFLRRVRGGLQLAGRDWTPVGPAFPAVTCTAQATMRTGQPAGKHGMVGNGFFSRELHKALFWEQSSAIVQGPRIWDGMRARGGRVGQMFWQQSLGRDSDLLLSPAPIHKHEGGMIQDCFAVPDSLYADITAALKKPFDLFRYWGPLASRGSSDWAVAATCEVMRRADAPELLLSYIPHLDYELQKSGPGSAASAAELAVLEEYLATLQATAAETGYRVLFYGDYAIGEVDMAAYPNRALLDDGLLRVRDIGGRQYVDLHASRAFAMVDHQVAHVITTDAAATDRAAALLGELPGVERVLRGDSLRAARLDHARSGDLVLVAEPRSWFAYPWWRDRKQAPDYAGHVDIHNKPGYDPCELYFTAWPLLSMETSQDTSLIHGSHGIDGPGAETVFTTDLDLGSPADLVALSQALTPHVDKLKS